MNIVTIEAPGVVAALNRGLGEIRTPLVAFTDDDAAPRPDWVQRIKEHFQRPEVGAVGGRDIIHHEGGLVEDTVTHVGSIRWFGRVVGNHHCESGIQEVAFLKGVNMSYRTQLLPGFDDRMAGAGAQVAYELQASLRLHLTGWRVIWDPAVAVDHFPAERFDADARDRPTWQAQVDSVENQTYALLSVLRGVSRLAVAAYGMTVGTRTTPGVLLAPALLFVSGSRRQVLRGLSINLAGHARGVAACLTRRAQPLIPGPPSLGDD
jgi:Glycosyltransferase like family 2